MKLNITQFKIKFKDKIEIENEEKFADNIIYYYPFFQSLDKNELEKSLQSIREEKKVLEKKFKKIKEEFSDILGEIAKIRFTANELYNQNRVIALTTGLLRHKLIDLHNNNVELPFDYEETLKFVEHFIYRYLTKKEDKRLVAQLPFKEI
ncbi:MAG: hypothetical protein K9W45_00340 [Candidatus Heimdallarchaeum aukensis]|uniref:Uncharacterized protein n=1 Tax=Candidatus Heimdallarchaeum aukensis TaxID=2876573 RepID=A0A9Y1BLF4_9ARCH|nr:MAG: hypothetical protein K9W45_00340 [Candidatus Heimdallarchaeum aukensis]